MYYLKIPLKLIFITRINADTMTSLSPVGGWLPLRASLLVVFLQRKADLALMTTDATSCLKLDIS